MTINVIDGQEVITVTNKELANLLLKPVAMGIGSPLNYFKRRDNVSTYVEDHLLSTPEEILQADTGAGWAASGSAALTAKRLSVGAMKVNFEMTNDNLRGTAWEDVLGAGVLIDDPNATEESRKLTNAVMRVVMSGTTRDMENIAFLNGYDRGGADTVPTWYADTLKSTDTGLTHPGILQKIEDAVALGNITEYTITGGAMTSTIANTTLDELYANQPVELSGFDDSQKEYWVTDDIYQKYIEHLAGLGSTESSYRVLVEGAPPVLTRAGIPIRKMGLVQGKLRHASYWNNANAHRAVLTVRNNFSAATNVATDETAQFQFWYTGLKEETFYGKMKIKFGVGYSHDELIVYGSDD